MCRPQQSATTWFVHIYDQGMSYPAHLCDCCKQKMEQQGCSMHVYGEAHINHCSQCSGRLKEER